MFLILTRLWTKFQIDFGKGGEEVVVNKPLADRLIDLSVRNAEQIAEQWHKALINNPRTGSYKSIARETCLRHAVNIYKNLGQMYFADNCYQVVAQNLDIAGFVEDHFARGIPLEEAIYALILMRRQIWLYSEQQSLFNVPEDMYELVQGINRVLLLFDYATYIVASKYRDLAGRTGKLYSK